MLLLLPELSPRLSTEMPLKLLALVTAGRRLRRELSESVLLQGRGSQHRSSVSVLLWWLLAERPDASLLILKVTNSTFSTSGACKIREKNQPNKKNQERKDKCMQKKTLGFVFLKESIKYLSICRLCCVLLVSSSWILLTF